MKRSFTFDYKPCDSFYTLNLRVKQKSNVLLYSVYLMNLIWELQHLINQNESYPLLNKNKNLRFVILETSITGKNKTTELY